MVLPDAGFGPAGFDGAGLGPAGFAGAARPCAPLAGAAFGRGLRVSVGRFSVMAIQKA
jgi:hypothetical protein